MKEGAVKNDTAPSISGITWYVVTLSQVAPRRSQETPIPITPQFKLEVNHAHLP
jgi:hypothetical protein